MKELSEQTHYEVLELAPGCAADALLKAYTQARERYGPGSLTTYALAEPTESEALLQRVEEAFAVLSDPHRRQAYDAAGGFVAVGSWGLASASIAAVATEEAAAPPAVPETAVAVSAVEAPPEPAPQPELKAEPVTPPPEPASPEVGATEAAPPEPVAPVLAESPVAEPAIAEPPAAEPAFAEPAVAKESPEHKPVRKTESDLPADSAVTGEALRRVREARGLTLKDVETRTKIGRWHLENIERERYADLPAQVYLRGFLMSLARELKLDPVRVAKSYLEQMKAKLPAKLE